MKKKGVYREENLWQLVFLFWLVFHLGDFKFIWELLRETSYNKYSPFIVKPAKHYFWVATYPWSFFFFHFVVSVCVMGTGTAIFWMGLLTIHKTCPSFCWKKAQLKSVSLPFHDTGMRGNQSRWDKSPKASCFQLFSSAKIFFFLPKMMLPFKGFLICRLFLQFISL